MEVQYQKTKDSLFHADTGAYVAYGIIAIDIANHSELSYVSDVSLEESAVDELVNLCNEENLELLHLADVINDFLN